MSPENEESRPGRGGNQNLGGVPNDTDPTAASHPLPGGMSTRAIASALGVSQRTILRALDGGRHGDVRGLDGKLYHSHLAPELVRDYIFGRSHYLSHDEAMTVRQIVAVLAHEGHRRSVGSIHAVLRRPCSACCSGDAFEAPEHEDDHLAGAR